MWGRSFAFLQSLKSIYQLVLWLVLRKKEELQRKRREEDRTEQK